MFQEDAAECKHPVQLFGMCALCGQPVDTESEESASLSVMHSNAAVKVSAEEAQRLDSETTSHLLSQRKLALIVDLDQTVIHATVDPTVGEWMKDESNPNYEALKSVGKFRLGIDGEEIKDDDDSSAPKDSAAALKASRACWYYVKPRPGVPEIVKKLSEKYQLHVYTMGTRSYANCVCKLIDPDASIFGNRILSRDENESLVRKSLNRLFPVDHSMVVIIDDREDVWSRSPNLLPVVPYEFFVGIGDINATFLPPTPAPPGAVPDSAAAGVVGAGVASTSASKLDDASSAASSPSPSPSAKSDTDAASSASTTTTSDTAIEEALQKASEEGKTEEEVAQVRATALQFAAQTEKLQSKLAEQREARPLAKMQEALDEKLGKTNGSGSRSGTATPNGSGSATPAGESSTEAESCDAVAAQTTAEEKTQATESSTPPSSSDRTLPPLPPPPPLPPHRSHAVLVDDDTELDRIYSILDSIHTEWYSAYDKLQSQTPTPTTKPSAVDLISARKTKVLAGCTIVFSSMIPTGHNPETSDLWALAREFGATPAFEVEEGVTTHVVAARQGTLKVVNATRLARAGKVELVWPSWFHVSTNRWERQDEALYRLPWEHEILDAFEWAQARVAEEKRQEEEKEKAKSQQREKATQEKALADEDGGEQGEALFESELNDMDWGAAADEVDAYLDSVTTASNTSSPSPSMLATDGDLPEINDGDEPIVGLSDSVGSKKRGRGDEEGEDGLQKKQRSAEGQGEREEEDDEDGGDSFLDDLANELDGQLDNE
ncbi:related to FCP1 - TFIIF interacting component of CTD phosphatase [Ustilago sp. UG-2017a]|nr:related to FCP1 - TFIIF interacting component of CTD phosphatase [Ustilago sp. UG-2017a]